MVSNSLQPHELYVAYQIRLSMGFSRQEHWSGLPFSSAVDLPHPGIEPESPALQAILLPTELPEKPKILVSRAEFARDLLSWGHGE